MESNFGVATISTVIPVPVVAMKKATLLADCRSKAIYFRPTSLNVAVHLVHSDGRPALSEHNFDVLCRLIGGEQLDGTKLNPRSKSTPNDEARRNRKSEILGQLKGLRKGWPHESKIAREVLAAEAERWLSDRLFNRSGTLRMEWKDNDRVALVATTGTIHWIPPATEREERLPIICEPDAIGFPPIRYVRARKATLAHQDGREIEGMVVNLLVVNPFVETRLANFRLCVGEETLTALSPKVFRVKGEGNLYYRLPEDDEPDWSPYQDPDELVVDARIEWELAFLFPLPQRGVPDDADPLPDVLFDSQVIG